jgi:hypothetical protein
METRLSGRKMNKEKDDDHFCGIAGFGLSYLHYLAGSAMVPKYQKVLHRLRKINRLCNPEIWKPTCNTSPDGANRPLRRTPQAENLVQPAGTKISIAIAMPRNN